MKEEKMKAQYQEMENCTLAKKIVSSKDDKDDDSNGIIEVIVFGNLNSHGLAYS